MITKFLAAGIVTKYILVFFLTQANNPHVLVKEMASPTIFQFRVECEATGRWSMGTVQDGDDWIVENYKCVGFKAEARS